jgi:peroxiredoxin
MRLSHKIVLVLCLAGFLVSCKRDGDKPSTARDFWLHTLARGRFYLNQQRGKVVVLVFWATWCSSCKGEMIELKSFEDIPGAEKLVVATICTDPENIDKVKETAKDMHINYPILLDRGEKVSRKYKISVLPTTIVIDKAGKISFKSEGYDSTIMEQLRTKVAGLLVSKVTNK